jgi:hypothetical protein
MSANALELLLGEACPSIRYRVRKELLGEAPARRHMRRLQTEILRDATVRSVISSQGADGWLGKSFHGDGGMEAGIRILCEKGLERHQPALARALVALKAPGDRLRTGICKRGSVLDEQGLGGPELIRAAVFAYAGVETGPFLKEQIRRSAQRVSGVVRIGALGRLAAEYRGKLVFRAGVEWPTIYDLRLLAFTSGWRSPASLRSVTEGIVHLLRLSPLPDIYVKVGSQLIAPASYGMHDFRRRLRGATPVQAGLWFHRMELLSRMDVIRRVPALADQLRDLKAILDEGGGVFTLPLRHDIFRRWGSYTGMMLEPDWRTQTRRVCDLTFRSLLVLRQA